MKLLFGLKRSESKEPAVKALHDQCFLNSHRFYVNSCV